MTRTVTLLHPHKDRRINVECGPAYRPPSRRPVRRLRVGRETIGINRDRLLRLALTDQARGLCDHDPSLAAVFLDALSLTELGSARTLQVVSDDGGGGVACAVQPFAWSAPSGVRRVPQENGET